MAAGTARVTDWDTEVLRSGQMSVTRVRLVTPSDEELTRVAVRYAIALRLGGTVACTLAAPLAVTDVPAALWLTLAAQALWTGVFAVALPRFLPPLLVLIDAALVVSVVLAQERLVPANMIADGTTWTLMLASTTIFIAQLLLRPVVGLCVAGLVTVAYVVSASVPSGWWFLALEAGIVSYLLGLLRRGGRSVDKVIAAGLDELHQARVREARRADEREQYRRLHDTVLSTLVMVAAGAFDRPMDVVSAKARDGLTIFTELAAEPVGRNGETALLPLLETAAERASPLDVRVTGTAVTLPTLVAESLAGAVAEALENVARHAGVGTAEVRTWSEGGVVVVEVTDAGAGFDVGQVPSSRRGIGQSIVGRLAAAGGTAEVTSEPSAGTRVLLRWPGA
jgi:two-component system, NarL family, sensor kinase